MLVDDWKTCRNCGEFLKKNKFGDNDCPKCNIENFLFPFKNRKKEKEDIIKEKPVPQDEEKEEVVEF